MRFFLVLFLISGCVTTRSEGEQMRSDLGRLKSQIAQIQKAQKEQDQKLENRLKRLEGRLSDQNESDPDKEVLKEEVQQLRNELDETKYQLDQLQKKPAAPVPSPEASPSEVDVPKTAQGYFAAAQEAYLEAEQSGNGAFYKKAVVFYQKLLSSFPKDPRCPEALFKVGKSLKAMGLYTDARLFFEELKQQKGPFAKKAQEELKTLPQTK